MTARNGAASGPEKLPKSSQTKQPDELARVTFLRLNRHRRFEPFASALRADIQHIEYKPNRHAEIGCGFNWSMQHLSSDYGAEEVDNEAATEDLLHAKTEDADVGPVASRGFDVCHSAPYIPPRRSIRQFIT
jgi:hypothetical protein